MKSNKTSVPNQTKLQNSKTYPARITKTEDQAIRPSPTIVYRFEPNLNSVNT